VLFLSKPLGFGTTTTAIKNQKASPDDITEVIDWMKRLNRQAAELAVECGVKSATDITGFSLLGHGWEMASASKVGMRISWENIPFTKGAHTYAEMYSFPGGAFDNKLYFKQHVRVTRELSEALEMLLYDPQTSGGLLFAVSPDCVESMMRRAEELNQPLWEIGEVVEGETIEIY
jgi:selenide,water dikinase